jgi:hypothetical protein
LLEGIVKFFWDMLTPWHQASPQKSASHNGLHMRGPLLTQLCFWTHI